MSLGFYCTAMLLAGAGNADVVMAPVTVVDDKGDAVSGLTKNQFRVFDRTSDKGEALPIVSFEHAQSPMSVVFVVDTSASMGSKVEQAQAALESFAVSANHEDEAALLTVGSQPELRLKFTKDLKVVARSIDSQPAAGNTALIDAIWQAMDVVRGGRYPRKALIVISDGGDNDSKHSEAELLEHARDADVQIYAIDIHDRTFSRSERYGSKLLQRLAQSTGGLDLEIRGGKELPEAMERITAATRNLYVIGFTPNGNTGAGKWHKVSVEVDEASGHSLRVNARSAYSGGETH